MQDMIFSGAIREADQNAASNPDTDWDAIKSRIHALSAANIFAFGMNTFKGYDKDTKTVTCGSYVSIHLPAKYKDSQFIEMSLHFTGSHPPEDLFGERPGLQIEYTEQMTADSKSAVISSNDVGPLMDSAFMLAGTDWLMLKSAAISNSSPQWRWRSELPAHASGYVMFTCIPSEGPCFDMSKRQGGDEKLFISLEGCIASMTVIPGKLTNGRLYTTLDSRAGVYFECVNQPS